MEPAVVRGIYVPRMEGCALHVLTYRKRGRWVSHCLEYDLEGEGNDRCAAFTELKRLLGLLFASAGRRGSGVPAPLRLWQLWESTSRESPVEVLAEGEQFSPLPKAVVPGRVRVQGHAA